MVQKRDFTENLKIELKFARGDRYIGLTSNDLKVCRPVSTFVKKIPHLLTHGPWQQRILQNVFSTRTASLPSNFGRIGG
jgi:hypothetical protein